jgi:hypothetical protein
LHTPLWTLLDTMHNSLDRQDGNPPSDCGIDWFSQLKHIAQQTRATLLAQPSQANCRGPAGLSPCTPVRWFLDRVCLCDGCSKGPCALHFFSCKFLKVSDCSSVSFGVLSYGEVLPWVFKQSVQQEDYYFTLDNFIKSNFALKKKVTTISS